MVTAGIVILIIYAVVALVAWRNRCLAKKRHEMAVWIDQIEQDWKVRDERRI